MIAILPCEGACWSQLPVQCINRKITPLSCVIFIINYYYTHTHTHTHTHLHTCTHAHTHTHTRMRVHTHTHTHTHTHAQTHTHTKDIPVPICPAQPPRQQRVMPRWLPPAEDPSSTMHTQTAWSVAHTPGSLRSQSTGRLSPVQHTETGQWETHGQLVLSLTYPYQRCNSR